MSGMHCSVRIKQFPPLSCHPPYVSSEELETLEQILKEHRRKLNL